jgi:hypothetical protein
MNWPVDRRGRLAPPPQYDATAEKAKSAERAAAGKVRSAMTRFAKAHGEDALISLLKHELQSRGEERWRLDQLAPPRAGADGQTSLLDSGT